MKFLSMFGLVIMLFAVVLFLTGSASQDNSEYEFKIFTFTVTSENGSSEPWARRANDEVKKWLRDNKIKHYEWQTAGGYGQYFFTIRYKK